MFESLTYRKFDKFYAEWEELNWITLGVVKSNFVHWKLTISWKFHDKDLYNSDPSKYETFDIYIIIISIFSIQ